MLAMLAAEAQNMHMDRNGEQLQAVLELAVGNVMEGLTAKKVVPQVPGGKDETI